MLTTNNIVIPWPSHHALVQWRYYGGRVEGEVRPPPPLHHHQTVRGGRALCYAYVIYTAMCQSACYRGVGEGGVGGLLPPPTHAPHLLNLLLP